MLIRREGSADTEAIRAVHAAAFASVEDPERTPAEAELVDALRADDDWIPELSFVAVDKHIGIVGHVVCTRGLVDSAPVLGLGPLGVLPALHGKGIGTALMHAVLGAADAMGEPLVVLLGNVGYYSRFGFRPAAELGIIPPVADWIPHFQARALTTYTPALRGEFSYAKPFCDV